MSDMDRYRDLYLEEAAEHLAALDDGLVRLEAGYDATVLDDVFRAAHSLKGMAATVGFADEADLAHALEDHLAHMRDARMAPSATVALLLEATDALQAAADATAHDTTKPDLPTMTARVRAFEAHATPPPNHPAEDTAPPSATTDQATLPEAVRDAAARLPGTPHCLRITLASDCIAPKARLLVTYRALDALGTIHHTTPAKEDWGHLDASDGVHVHFLIEGAEPETCLDRVGRIPDIANVTLVDLAATQPEPRAAPPSNHLDEATVRVPATRIDQLLDVGGEVRIALAQLDRLLADHFVGDRPYALTEALVRLNRETKDLHDAALALRTLPVSVITSRFNRLVRDIARDQGKQVRLMLQGEGTEVDRSVLEALSDPVMHLVKNAIDHGIETPEDRRAANKDPTATLSIRFERTNAGIQIDVEDDGRGIDRHRVAARGIETSAMPATTNPDELTDTDLLALLTQPGFSTAHQVTEVSGRGVGLDVVQDRLNAIGGTLRLRTRAGTGTRMRLTLPPTLALVEALELVIDGDPYYIGVDNILTSVELSPDDHARGTTIFQDLREFAEVSDDDAVPVAVEREVRLVDLDATLGIRARRIPYQAAHGPGGATAQTGPPPSDNREDGPDESPSLARYGLVVERHGHMACLALERLGGIEELVVKDVDLPGASGRHVSGAAIRGDGRVGLLLDVPSLIGTPSTQAADDDTRSDGR